MINDIFFILPSDPPLPNGDSVIDKMAVLSLVASTNQSKSSFQEIHTKVSVTLAGILIVLELIDLGIRFHNF